MFESLIKVWEHYVKTFYILKRFYRDQYYVQFCNILN